MTKPLSVIVIIFEIIFMVALAFAYDLSRPVYIGESLKVEQGQSIRQIIANLPKEKVKPTPLDARILASFGTVSSGWLDLGKEPLSKIDFWKMLANAKPVMQSVTLIPGETTVIFLEGLAKKFGVDFNALERDYNATAPFYEGFLVPDTYSMAKDLNASDVMRVMASASAKFHEEGAKKADLNATAWREVLIKASIIQKEAANADEMPVVASVIENRLERGMPLQMDGTLNYGRYSHVRVTPERIRTDKSGYNTYAHEGLPDAVVCTVSPEAIEAALHPATTEYLYFMLDRAKGTHIFTRTLDEHNAVVRSQR